MVMLFVGMTLFSIGVESAMLPIGRMLVPRSFLHASCL
jgi:hypothetical protein